MRRMGAVAGELDEMMGMYVKRYVGLGGIKGFFFVFVFRFFFSSL